VQCNLSDEAADMPVRLLDDIVWDGEALLVTGATKNGRVTCRVPRDTIHKRPLKTYQTPQRPPRWPHPNQGTKTYDLTAGLTGYLERKAAAERRHSARILFSLTSEFGDNSNLHGQISMYFVKFVKSTNGKSERLCELP
jgi:hypothetical protein